MIEHRLREGPALNPSALRALCVALIVSAPIAYGCQSAFSLGWDASLRSLCVLALTVFFVATQVHRHPHPQFGPANSVTLARACFTAILAGFIAEPRAVTQLGWVLVVSTIVVAVSDALDGKLARKSGLQSAFGARFDMEVDALFMLILCVLAFQQNKVGAWVFSIGAMRYVFAAAGVVWPRLSRELPPSTRRQSVCVIQVAVLIACLAPVVHRPLAEALLLVALCLLVYSFARDIFWLCSPPNSQETSA